MSERARVLIIGDDARTWRALQSALRERGHAVEKAASGAHGVAELRAGRVDAAIVDLPLPDVGGLDLQGAIESTSPPTAVVFTAEAASLDTVIRTTGGTGFAYLVKPFEMEYVLATLERAVARRRPGPEPRESEAKRAGPHVHLETAALEAAANGIIITDREGVIVWANPAFTVLTGFGAAETIGQTPRILKSERHDPSFYVDLWATILAGRVWRGETINRRKDGSLYTEDQTITPIRDESGEITHFVAIKQDITGWKELQAELAESEKQAAMGRLLAGVAHLLNNPLAVVLGHAALLREEAESAPIARRADRISQAADRCADIVRDFVALAGRRSGERRRVALNEIVQRALESLADALRADAVELRVDLAETLPELLGDPQQLRQAVVTLAGGAHQAMLQTPGPRRLGVVTRFDPARGRAILELADTGPAMPPDVQARLFEPFLVPGPRGHGTELGLALCQAIIEDHGGRIGTESPAGLGVVVRIELPVAAPSATEPGEASRGTP